MNYFKSNDVLYKALCVKIGHKKLLNVVWTQFRLLRTPTLITDSDSDLIYEIFLKWTLLS